MTIGKTKNTMKRPMTTAAVLNQWFAGCGATTKAGYAAVFDCMMAMLDVKFQ